MLDNGQSCRMRETHKKALHDASYRLFPDLVLEMGLCCIDPGVVHLMLKDPESEDQVRWLGGEKNKILFFWESLSRTYYDVIS